MERIIQRSVAAVKWLWLVLRRETKFGRRMEIKWIHKWAGITPGDLVCDIGCGDGYYTWRLGRNARLVIGVDISPSSLLRARRYRFQHCQFVLAAAEYLPFRDAVFDRVVSVCAWEHFKDDKAAFAEAARTLKSRGILAISTDSLSLPYIPMGWRKRHQQQAEVKNYYTIDSIHSKLEAAGLCLTDARYLVTSRLSSLLVRLASRWGGRCYSITFPVFYPLVLLADRLGGSTRGGHKLVIRAEKARSFRKSIS